MTYSGLLPPQLPQYKDWREGDIAKALAGGAAPYLAEEIHKRTITGDKVNIPANLMAHAVVNAALSLEKGENALAGASSAVTAEAVGLISKSYYDKTLLILVKMRNKKSVP
ncbi:hypothetical protein [Rosenbergiella epipactidis]|uniref:hypothetical protein n=1 Tax=Rosenbergiella epipactidis TaxID=1544694 RepID=UPI0030C8B711